MLARLIAERRYAIDSVLLNAAALAALEPALAEVPTVPVYVGPEGFMAALTGHDFHRGCLALVRRPPPRRALELVASARCCVLLESVANPDNIGGVFRNAAAFGVDAVLLSPTSGDPLYRKAIRTSMGATLRVPFATLGDGAEPWPACLRALRMQGFELCALTPHVSALDIADYRTDRSRVALLLGAEGDGLSAGAFAFADRRLRIPIDAAVDSLNLAVASGVALHCLTRRGAVMPKDVR